jgi:hypothetical protein
MTMASSIQQALKSGEMDDAKSLDVTMQAFSFKVLEPEKLYGDRHQLC